MTVEEFKVIFKSYIKFIKEENDIRNRIEELYYELSGVKGIRYDKIPTSFNRELASERQLILIELIETKQAELEYLIASHKYVNIVMSKFSSDDIALLYRLLIKKQSYESVGLELGYSAGGLWKYVQRLIEEAI